jgi:hypothetical protein
MRARRTVESNQVFRLPGGTEDNDLWVRRALDSGGRPVICSVWELDEDERAAIAAGANVELVVWGDGTPPVAMHTTTVALGRPGGGQ